MVSGRAILLIAVATVLALPVAVATLWVWESLSTEPSAEFEGFSFQILAGEGGVTQSGLELRRAGVRGQGIVAVRIRDLPAERFRAIKFSIIGLDQAVGAGIYWNRKDAPSVSQARPLTLEEVRTGEVRLEEDARWSGEIQTFGFIAQGPFRGVIVIRSLGFVADDPTLTEVASRVADNWLNVADWDGGSLNFYIGAARDERRLTPAIFALVWLFAAFSLFMVFRRYDRREDLAAVPIAIVALIGLITAWGALDIRWQRDLWHRNVTPTDDAVLAVDRRRAKLWGEIKSRIFDSRSRIFMVTDDPAGYVALRTRYHLGTASTSFGMLRLPSSAERRAGDFILVLSSREPLRFDPSSNTISGGNERIPVVPLFDSREIGALFQVRESESPR